MNMHTATETTYDNSFTAGYRRALQDFVRRVYEECRIYGPDDKFNKVKCLKLIDEMKTKLEPK